MKVGDFVYAIPYIPVNKDEGTKWNKYMNAYMGSKGKLIFQYSRGDWLVEFDARKFIYKDSWLLSSHQELRFAEQHINELLKSGNFLEDRYCK